MGSEDEIIFCQEDFMSKSFDVFEDMRRKEELVDFKVNLGNRSVLGHRLVLAARIPHFRKIFCGPETEVPLEEVNPDVLELVIDFAYSGKIKITSGNVMTLISVSKMFQLPQVYDACWEFLKRRFNFNNVLEFRRVAENHGCTTFLEAADNYMRQNFEEFSNSKSFLDLPFLQFKEIICRDDIKVSTEEKVFEAVIMWIKSSESERRDLLPELLSDVRMYFLTPGYLIERVSTEELVRSSLLCRDLVDEAKSYHLLPDKRSKFCRLSSQPRLYEKKAVSPPVSPQTGHSDMHHLSADVVPQRTVIYSVYASTDNQSTNVKRFDPEGGRWLHVSSCEMDLSENLVVPMDDVIYIFHISRIYTFNVNSSKWSSLGCEENILASSGVSYNGRIYFFGGIFKPCFVRAFVPEKKMFVKGSRMKRPVSFPAVALLSSSGGTALSSETPIFITGGESDGHICKKVEIYNPETKRWLGASSMRYERCRHGCSNLNGKIYVFGGLGKEWELLSSAEVFDPFTYQWSSIASMTEARGWLSVISDDAKVYVYGKTKYSWDDPGCMEIYDTRNDEWKMSASVPHSECHKVYLVKTVIPVGIQRREDVRN